MLEVAGLVKRFGPLAAVDGVSFTVPPGEVLGFLGPNGAGKSTTMKMIAGFLAPSAGTAVVCGHDIRTDALAAKRRLGYLPEGAPAYPDMSAAALFAFIARIRGLRGAEARRRISYIAELLRIGEVMHQPFDTLPKGYRRRVGVAQALLHDPPVVILDEPTDGLDPNQKYEMRGILAEMRPQKAIIVSTNLLEEVEVVCSRALIIARGRIVADGTPAELAARSRYHNAVRLDLPDGVDLAIAGELANLPGVRSVEPAQDGGGDGLWLFPRNGRPIVAEVAGIVRTRGWKIAGLRAERGRLDEVFREITTAPAPPNASRPDA